jgi:hypothetical protein
MMSGIPGYSPQPACYCTPRARRTACHRRPAAPGEREPAVQSGERRPAPSGERGPAAAPPGERLPGPAPAPSAERGQASVELLALLPALIALSLAALQLLAVGYAVVLAGSAAEAGALALAAGADAEAGVREALPGWSRAGARVSVDDGEVTVRLRPPSALRALAERLEVTGKAAVEDP